MNGDPSDGVHHLAAAYCLDALDAGERARFEAHLADCDSCRVEVAELSATAGLLAGADAATPPPDLKAKVMAEVASTRQLSPVPDGGEVVDVADVADVVDLRTRRRSAVSWLAVAAAVALLAVGAVLVVAQRGGDGIDDHLAAPDLVVTELSGDAGAIRVAWSPGRDRVAVFGNDLDEPGEGRVYELWAIAGGAPVPAGLFRPDDGTVRRLVDLDDVVVEAWGVTIEPEGGSPQPTGDILYFGEV